MQHGIDQSKIKEFIGLNESLHRLFQNYMTKRLNSTLSLPQMFLLHILLQQGPCTPSHIAQLMGVTSGAITSLADRLHKQNLITRERSESDRRVVMITLSDEGRQLYNKLESESVEHLTALFNKLPAEDVDNLINILYKIYDIISSLEKTNSV
ncbi:MarR family transcriptional regulator [Peptococcaceae bacterium 1198_IL3148]